MVGALILDSTQNRVVLFNPAKSSEVDKIKPPIDNTITATAKSFHLLFNVFPNSLYTVKRNNIILTTTQSSGDGVLKFKDPNFGSNVNYHIELAQGATLGEYPSEPEGQLDIWTKSNPDTIYQKKR